MLRKKSIGIFTIIAIVIFIALIFVYQSKPDTLDLIERYFTIRYDNVNSSNLLKKVERLSEFYSEELQNSESWLTNEDNIEDSYTTMKTYGTHSELSSLLISNIDKNNYQVTIYVLYNTADKTNTHYIYYLMNVATVLENSSEKISNIELIEQIPVFTGGTEMSLDSVKHEIEKVHKEHTHHEQ